MHPKLRDGDNFNNDLDFEPPENILEHIFNDFGLILKFECKFHILNLNHCPQVCGFFYLMNESFRKYLSCYMNSERLLGSQCFAHGHLLTEPGH